jgi:hypothetical protein
MAQNSNPTQEFVPIKEVRDGIMILKDGGMRAILLCSSLNFSLKSEDERNAILIQFQDFLNSLDFSIEIVVQSRRLDIRPYIALLEEREKEQTNDLMRIQVREYIEFVKSFTESTSIMTKSFFIVIPYSPTIMSSASVSKLSSFLPTKGPKQKASIKESNFEEDRTQLEERLAVVEQGLTRTGIRVERLETEVLIELFYKAFNPGETEKPVKAS